MDSKINWEDFLLEAKLKGATSQLTSIIAVPKGYWREFVKLTVEELEERYERDPKFRKKVHSLGYGVV